MTNLRRDWVTRQYVSIALTLPASEAAKYMADHNVPLHVALRVLGKGH
jgi:hypothetical protein